MFIMCSVYSASTQCLDTEFLVIFANVNEDCYKNIVVCTQIYSKM